MHGFLRNGLPERQMRDDEPRSGLDLNGLFCFESLRTGKLDRPGNSILVEWMARQQEMYGLSKDLDPEC